MGGYCVPEAGCLNSWRGPTLCLSLGRLQQLLLIVHKVGCFSSPSLVLETQNVSGELRVPSPWWKLEVLVLVSVKESAVVPTEQLNSAPRAKTKAAKDFLSGVLPEGTASNWVGPPTSIEVIGRFRWGSYSRDSNLQQVDIKTSHSRLRKSLSVSNRVCNRHYRIMDDLASCG